MRKFEAWYDHDGPVEVETAPDLDDVLDNLAGWRGGNLVQFVDAVDPFRSGFLDVGIDAVRGVGVALYSGQGKGCWTFNGDAFVAEEPVLYYYMNCDTEYPTNAEIPLADVRRLAHAFMASGVRPLCVQWQPYR